MDQWSLVADRIGRQSATMADMVRVLRHRTNASGPGEPARVAVAPTSRVPAAYLSEPPDPETRPAPGVGPRPLTAVPAQRPAALQPAPAAGLASATAQDAPSTESTDRTRDYNYFEDLRARLAQSADPDD